jgi:hypothetical protein
MGAHNPRRKTMTTKKQPANEIRIGRIRCTAWANPGPHGPRYNFTFSRLYKPEGGGWKDTSYFGRDDLLTVARLAQEAHAWAIQAAIGGNESSEQTAGEGV